MRILFVGDVVGRAGRTAIADHLPGMVSDWSLDLVVVNGENSAGGFGITEAIYQELIDAGADAITLGNHAWDQRDGAFAGGAVLGWIVGVVKARTGAHEVILTIMLNYIMYNLLSFLLTGQSLMQAPKQTNAVAPGIASSAMLPHVGGPPPQVGVGFLIAVAAAAATAWLLSRSTLGFQFRTVGASPSAARSAGISVERVWILAFLIAGGLAGLSATTIVQGQTAPLTTTSYGTFGFDGITVALLGRARPWGVLIAGLLFGALNAGGTVMEAATGVPSDVVNVIEALIVLFVAAPPLIRLLFRLRATGGTGPQAVASKGWSG